MTPLPDLNDLRRILADSRLNQSPEWIDHCVSAMQQKIHQHAVLQIREAERLLRLRRNVGNAAYEEQVEVWLKEQQR